jgi:hypothetical protein
MNKRFKHQIPFLLLIFGSLLTTISILKYDKLSVPYLIIAISGIVLMILSLILMIFNKFFVK